MVRPCTSGKVRNPRTNRCIQAPTSKDTERDRKVLEEFVAYLRFHQDMDENPNNPVPNHWESHKIGRIQQVLAMLDTMEQDVKASKDKNELLEDYLYRIREALRFPNIYEPGLDGPNRLISSFLKSRKRSKEEMRDYLELSAYHAYAHGKLKSTWPLPSMNKLIQTRGYHKVLRMKDRERYRQAKIHKHL